MRRTRFGAHQECAVVGIELLGKWLQCDAMRWLLASECWRQAAPSDPQQIVCLEVFYFYFFNSTFFFVYLARLRAAENIAARLRQHGYGSGARAEMTKDLLQDDVDALRWLLATDNATAHLITPRDVSEDKLYHMQAQLLNRVRNCSCSWCSRTLATWNDMLNLAVLVKIEWRVCNFGCWQIATRRRT